MSDTIPPDCATGIGLLRIIGPSPDLSYWLTETLVADAGLLLWRRARRQL